MRMRMARALIVGGVGGAGLMAGHTTHYFVLFPAADARHAILEATGHGYLPAALLAAVLVGLLGIAATAGLGFARGCGSDAPRVRLPRMAGRLATLQTLAFLTLEMGERLLAGVSPTHHLGLILAVGIPIQILLAVLGAALLGLIDAGGERAGRALASRPRLADAGPRLLPPRTDRRAGRVGTPTDSIRAPPIGSSTQPAL